MPEARQKLAAKTQELLSTPADKLPYLVIEIQKLRVLCMLLAEAEEGGKSDPNTYREMSMLNRMLAAGPGEDEGAAGDDLIAEEEAATRLAKRGVSREAIPGMLRILTAMSGRGPKAEPPKDDDEEGDESDMVN